MNREDRNGCLSSWGISRLAIAGALISIVPVLFVSLNQFFHFSISRKSFFVFSSLFYFITALAGKAWQSGYGRLTLITLCFYFFADANMSTFLFGAFLFLVGHLFLIGAFLLQGIQISRLWRAAIFYLLLSGVISVWLVPQVKSAEQTMVVAYIFTLTTMSALAAGTRGVYLNKVVALGAFFFYVSDLFLAIVRYTPTQLDYTLFGYPLYYGACVLFALSVSVHRWEHQPEGKDIIANLEIK